MKGVELPINILVIVAVAVIVLLGLIALYFSGFLGPAGTITAQTAKGKYCAMVTQNPNGCEYLASGGVDLSLIQVTEFDANQDGTINAGNTFVWADACRTKTDNLIALLKCHFGITTERDAKKACGCAI